MLQISELMNRHPVTISEEDDLPEMERLMRERQVRHLPVVRGGRLVGLISHRDFLQALERSRRQPAAERLAACDFMKTDLVTVDPMTSLDQAVRRVIDQKIGCLPVLSGGKLVGLVTETDLLRFCAQMIQERDRRDLAYGADA